MLIKMANIFVSCSSTYKIKYCMTLPNISALNFCQKIFKHVLSSQPDDGML